MRRGRFEEAASIAVLIDIRVERPACEFLVAGEPDIARARELGQQLGDGLPKQDQDAPQVAQLRQDLDRLRQEVELAVRASKQESQETSVAVREILELAA